MLQLLLEGGERYEDLAALLGVPIEEVRSRAAAALQELAANGLEDAGQTADFLLGQAGPEAIAATEAHLAGDADQLAVVRRLHARLRLLYPAAGLPSLPAGVTSAAPAPVTERPTAPPAPEPPAPQARPEPPSAAPATSVRPAAPPPEPEPESEPAVEPATDDRAEEAEPALTLQQKRLLALLAAGGLIVVVIVLAVAGVFSEGSASEGEGSQATATAEEDSDTALTRAVLQPTRGNRGGGVAIFGAIDEQTPVLQVTARGLTPTRDGEEYSVWLYQTDEIALRLAGLEVGKNGRIVTQIELPAEALNFIVDGTLNQVDVSRNRKSAYRQEVKASQSEGRLPRRIGASVLRGRITGPGLGTGGGQ